MASQLVIALSYTASLLTIAASALDTDVGVHRANEHAENDKVRKGTKQIEELKAQIRANDRKIPEASERGKLALAQSNDQKVIGIQEGEKFVTTVRSRAASWKKKADALEAKRAKLANDAEAMDEEAERLLELEAQGIETFALVIA